jgi:TonB-linked SusC/RagA family outer membrane protein
MLFFSAGMARAQDLNISGRVVDAAGDAVVGASVVVKGTTTGVTTGINGDYDISAPSDGTLTFSFLGLGALDVAVNGRARLDVRLAESDQQIQEVVITALGIKRSEKSVGYATSTVKSDELTNAKPVSVMNALAGKVAGVNITQGGGTGTSQKVVIRGFSSLNANNPLYVIDGVPILNSYTGGAADVTAATYLNNAADFGNLANDINPDDVESVTVLKGASATALYGSQAANGVILITTKRGSTDSRLQVVYSGSVMVSNVLRTPQFQNMFGEGWPLFDPAENGSWGPKLDGMEREWGAPLNSQGVYDEDNGVYRTKPFSYVENNIRNFYEYGLEYSNSVSITGGTQHTGFALSYSNVSADGVIPTNADKYVRNTFSFRGNSKYKKFSANYNISYVRKDIDAVRSGQGSGGAGSTVYQEIIQMPVDVSIKRDLKDYNNPYNNLDNYFTPYAQNPYWVVANNTSTYGDDHILGKVEAELELIKGLSLMGRLGGDFANYHTFTRAAVAKASADSWQKHGGVTDEPGYYGEQYYSRNQIDAMGLLNADYKIGTDFRVTGVAGFNYQQSMRGYLDSYLSGLEVPGWYSLSNGTALPNSRSLPFTVSKRLMGALAQGDVSFREWAFLGVSLRNDWSSTLPKGNNSYFYWGVNGSAILTDAIPALKAGNVVNFLKVRGGWGQTGNDAPLYLTNSYYSPTQIGLGFGSLYLPLNNTAGLTESNRIPSNSLRPEITTEVELGFDARFLQNRIGVDFAWYNRNTKDQIISAGAAPETGYTSRARNVGLINNTGVEVRLYGTPVKTTDFQWELSVTFAKNYSLVKELWDDVEEFAWMSAYDIRYDLIKGQPLGIFRAPKVATTDDGKVIVNANGFPTVLSDEFEVLGSSNPDFTMGFSTKFSWKGLSVSALFDWRKGGVMYSNTARMLDWNGNGTNTMFNEREPFLIPNSVKVVGKDANDNDIYAENDIPVMHSTTYAYYNYTSYNKGMEKSVVLDKSFFKLRELSVSYSLPRKWFAGTFIGGIEVSAVGRNLFMWTAKGNNFIDPEATNYGNDLDSELGEFHAPPSVRTFGGMLKLTF